jgi:hypothetical protein
LSAVDFGVDVHDLREYELRSLILGAIQFVFGAMAIVVGICSPRWLLFKLRDEVWVVVSSALA